MGADSNSFDDYYLCDLSTQYSLQYDYHISDYSYYHCWIYQCTGN